MGCAGRPAPTPHHRIAVYIKECAVGMATPRNHTRTRPVFPDDALIQAALQFGWFYSPHYRHVVGKGGAVNWNAELAPGLNRGLNSVCRAKLNRLMRRTKGYTGSLEMLVYSLALIC